MISRDWLREATALDPARMPTPTRYGLERTLDLHTWLEHFNPTLRLS
jgi:asparagine synthase (glutamine-hydrolysing)